MNSNQKKLAIGTVVAAALATAYHLKHQQIIVARFPDLDPKVVKKAYRKILKDTYGGKYANVDTTDEFLDNEILKEYANLISQ